MTDSNKQSAGGRARAKSISAERRSQIAREAAAARWSKSTVSAIAAGEVDLGGVKVPAFVLPDETRILSRAAFVRAIGRKGKVKGGRQYDDNFETPVFLTADNLQPFISQSMRENFRSYLFEWDGKEYIGYNAELLMDVCNIFLDAERLGVLRNNQIHIAEQCRILQRAFARLGVIGLVDEATGYQKIRANDSLAKLLEAYVQDEIAEWVKTFPDEFYQQLFRLRDLDPGKGTNRPAYFGHLTNNIVYDRITPGLRAELKEKVPQAPNGKKKHQMHRHLTPQYGHPKLREHLASVVTIMQLSTDWEDFNSKLDSIHPKYSPNLELHLIGGRLRSL